MTYGETEHPHAACRERIAELEAEVALLKDELAESLVATLRSSWCSISTGTMAGWVDSCAMATAMEAGDRLVELGLWERHPNGYGRRWFYRRVQAAEAAGGEG